MKTEWNADLYDNKHDFVSKFGEGVVALLQPQPGEKILDVGCGTGDLAHKIQQAGAKVIGIDSSETMIAQAKEKYPQIQFTVKSATDFYYQDQFDAIFSNATLHWVLEKEKAIKCIYKSLRPGGRFVAEFGGKDNVGGIVRALRMVLSDHQFNKQVKRNIWYFPSIAEYATLLEKAGFRVTYAVHFDRETELTGEGGMQNWLKMFAPGILEGLNESAIQTVVEETESQLWPTHFRDGKWYADYKRLRVVAIKS